MKDTPPWWWKLGWTLAEATPQPKPLMTSENASWRLGKNTAAKAESVISGATRKTTEKKGGYDEINVPRPLGFWPSKTKKGDW